MLIFSSRQDQVGKPETDSGVRMCVCMRVCVYVYTHMCVKNILIFALWYRSYAWLFLSFGSTIKLVVISRPK